MTDIQRIRYIGPKSSKLLIAAGIKTAEDLVELGAVKAYVKVIKKFPEKRHWMFLYVMYTGLQNKHFTDISKEEKLMLQKEVEKLMKAH